MGQCPSRFNLLDCTSHPVVQTGNGRSRAHTHKHRIYFYFISSTCTQTLPSSISHPEIVCVCGVGVWGVYTISEMSRCFKEEICIGVRQQFQKYDLDSVLLPIFLALAFEKKTKNARSG